MPKTPRRKPATSSTDALKRSGRGGIQTVTAASVIALFNVFAPHPLSTEQSLALTPILGFLLSFIQNYLEDSGTIGKLWKTPAPASTDVPTQKLLADLTGELADFRRALAETRPAEPERIVTRQLVPDGAEPLRG